MIYKKKQWKKKKSRLELNTRMTARKYKMEEKNEK